MDFIVDFLLAIVLFVLLSPGILVRLPPNGSKWTVAIVHGIIFAIAMYFVYLYVLPNFEGYKEGAITRCKDGYKGESYGSGYTAGYTCKLACNDPKTPKWCKTNTGYNCIAQNGKC